jgi:hypothetical protein
MIEGVDPSEAGKFPTAAVPVGNAKLLCIGGLGILNNKLALCGACTAIGHRLLLL